MGIALRPTRERTPCARGPSLPLPNRRNLLNPAIQCVHGAVRQSDPAHLAPAHFRLAAPRRRCHLLPRHLERQREARLQRRSQKLSRSILGGVFSEQVAPFLPDFPKDLKASEARFIGKPIDFLIFKGMDEQHIDEVVFVEIKSGSSQLSSNERSLRDAIEAKRVRWHEYRVDPVLSKMPAPNAAEEPPAP